MTAYGTTDIESTTTLTNRPRRGDRALLKLSLIPLGVRWRAWSVITTTSTLWLRKCLWCSSRLVGITCPGPLAVTLGLILPGPTRWWVELWRCRVRLRWGRRCRTWGATLIFGPKGQLEWLKGLRHHIPEPLQQGFPL